MNEYKCLECGEISYSAARLEDLYFPYCNQINCKGELIETDPSDLELKLI